MNTEELKSELTEDEKRVKIAEALGWAYITKTILSGIKPGRGNQQADLIPDYFNSLDACAEFEKTLTMEECIQYNHKLWKRIELAPIQLGHEGWVWGATAEQRCEAYAKVKGLW